MSLKKKKSKSAAPSSTATSEPVEMSAPDAPVAVPDMERTPFDPVPEPALEPAPEPVLEPAPVAEFTDEPARVLPPPPLPPKPLPREAPVKLVSILPDLSAEVRLETGKMLVLDRNIVQAIALQWGAAIVKLEKA